MKIHSTYSKWNVLIQRNHNAKDRAIPSSLNEFVYSRAVAVAVDIAFECALQSLLMERKAGF